MPIKLNSSTLNNGGSAVLNNTSLSSIKSGTTEVWKKQTEIFNGGTISGYSWSDGFTPTYANMGVGTTIWSNSDNQASGVAEGYKRCAFNASNFSKINVNVTACSASKQVSSDNTACYVYIGTEAQSTQNLLVGPTFTRGGKCESTGLKEFDVSGLSGTYYICIGGAKSTGNSYNIVVDHVYGV